MALYVGTCGFSYRDWIGPFYPKGIKSAGMLPFYAERFGAVEIDSTYYAIPDAKVFAAMDRRTPPAFRFTVKAPGSVTHVPAPDEPLESDVKSFRECLEPLRAANKLAAVLAQFPNAFRPGGDAYRRLERLREWWPDFALVAEFRRREWQRDETLARLRELGIGWCNVDEPLFASLMRPSADVTSPVGYIRFHGRNYEKWWRQEGAAHERYSYLYSHQELERWLPRIAEVEETARDTFVFFNNHHLGCAAANAQRLSQMLGVAGPGQPVPQTSPQPRLL